MRYGGVSTKSGRGYLNPRDYEHRFLRTRRVLIVAALALILFAIGWSLGGCSSACNPCAVPVLDPTPVREVPADKIVQVPTDPADDT